ncbi:sec-independent translocase [Streptomyces avicenniae]|uniref:sec-independent translocase n=1 Tax=Streptomyces avicenniae TaxID=500153 RepID=UPI000699FA66|nr:sec-independent translocase [Streptomyces avicenniae]
MFFDIGSLEFIVLLVLAILVFGPEKLPKMIQEAAAFIRKIREFSDTAKRDIRSELGPEFKDFDFEDLNPRTFAKKHLLDNDDLGLRELGTSLDMRKELSDVADAVNSRPDGPDLTKPSDTAAARPAAGPVSLAKDTDVKPVVPPPATSPAERSPYDADAT